MNDNTIIRIKVPASLYESVKAKLMIKENFETPVKEDNRRGLDAETIEAVKRAFKMIMQEINVEKDPQQRDLLKKTTVNLGTILQWLEYKYMKKGTDAFGPLKPLKEAKKADPKKAAEEKKKKEAEREDAQYKSDMKTKKEAEAKKKEAEAAAAKKKAEREDAQYKSDMKTKKEAEAKKKNK